MLFDLLDISANGKYAKVVINDTFLVFPTLLTLTSTKENDINWLLGDSGKTLSINLPPSGLTQELSNKKTTIQFIANILMHEPLQVSFVLNNLQKTTALIADRLKIVPPENALVMLQPNTDPEILDAVTKTITKYKIRHVGITNFTPLLNTPRKALEFILRLRQLLPLDTLLYLFSPVPHTVVPILSYCGVDAFNSGYVQLATKSGLYLTAAGALPLTQLSEKICSCKICADLPVSELQKSLLENNAAGLDEHNMLIYQAKVREVRYALKQKDLRSYVEQNLFDTFTATALRLLDSLWTDMLISRTATWLSTPIYHLTPLSYYRPAVQVFQRRVRERFDILPHKKIVVIFPCSARKPYSFSKSHRKFLEVINSLPKDKQAYIQQLILTSPLGVIPRELELVYPAAHYDIPVTGLWSEEEKAVAVQQLTSVLLKARKQKPIVIAHVSDEYLPLCQEAEQKLKTTFVYTVAGSKPTAFQALANLKKTLLAKTADLPPRQYSKDLEFVRAISDYQFGLGIGEKLFPEPVTLKQKPNQNIFLFKGKNRIGVIHHRTGQLMLTVPMGMVLAKQKKYYLKLHGEELKGSTIFAVGVFEADPEIRPSDGVVILNEKDELLGVGVASLSGSDMVSMSSGRAAKVKTKVKSLTKTHSG
ncbi:MAG: DUF5591 domain-containing protein [Candidatus Heimdallarchaeota archaeon]|nr:DUF5591 domain-containing protein [Candidatus Heimdallarchaeota archaeon]